MPGIHEDNPIGGKNEPPVPYVYDERTFNRMLANERKRTERSKRQFILLLLSWAETRAGLNALETYDKILASLCSSIRDIDVLGWYRSGEVLGIIFPEIDDALSGTAKKSILDRIHTNLDAGLDPLDREDVEISLYQFPLDCTLPELYPDVQRIRSRQKFPLMLKRAMDIVGSLAAFVVFSPLFLAISISIKLTSDGPVLFRQRRVGQHGKPFTFLKFRSMYVNNDPAIHREYVKRLINGSNADKENCADENGVFKIQNDPRVTRVGRIIRKTSLDELPQFINVLMGEMSLVGPRPPIPYECENYEIWHKRRILDMKPGITGIWQVEGRSRTTFDEMVRLDLYYIRNWSLWLDIKILLKTPWAVLTSKGAY